MTQALVLELAKVERNTNSGSNFGVLVVGGCVLALLGGMQQQQMSPVVHGNINSKEHPVRAPCYSASPHFDFPRAPERFFAGVSHAAPSSIYPVVLG